MLLSPHSPRPIFPSPNSHTISATRYRLAIAFHAVLASHFLPLSRIAPHSANALDLSSIIAKCTYELIYYSARANLSRREAISAAELSVALAWCRALLTAFSFRNVIEFCIDA